ncbi:threonine aldolase family protein [Aestuariivirga litoralis]|uniref:threonine aldolase family protein n=1 Tax=Aestuariivirga litoralis TaxID=2650924 RepID=UPI0018C63AC0|nr:low specificity L-threonine aldolase [Aestuariivirga litoralis]MBG1233078.1 low specificity L-threonine aldolase [Aestuariivirga litoralis]
MNFNSDNVYGVHPQIMDAIVAANARLTDVSYCHDDSAKEAEAALSKLFEKPVRAFSVMNGTGANSLSLSALCPPFGGIICHQDAHISTDECNCPELFTGGAKLLTVPGAGNKITPDSVSAKIAQYVHGEHGPKPSALSLSQATELGRVYTLAEIKALSDVAHKAGLKVHMDGARFANALVWLGCTPAEMTWKAGIDVLSFGGTKNGAMILESVVFFDEALAEDFLYRRKRAGQLLSKGRFLSAQMHAYLKDDLWLKNAGYANVRAAEAAAALTAVSGVRLAAPVEANEVFPIMPRRLFEALEKEGVKFYEWPLDGLAADECCARLVLSFATPEADVAKFAGLVKRLGN